MDIDKLTKELNNTFDKALDDSQATTKLEGETDIQYEVRMMRERMGLKLIN